MPLSNRKFTVFLILIVIVVLNVTLYYSNILKLDLLIGASWLSNDSARTPGERLNFSTPSTSIETILRQYVVEDRPRNAVVVPTASFSNLSEIKLDDEAECRFADLEGLKNEIKWLVKKHLTVNCSRQTPNLVYASGDFLYVNLTKLNLTNKDGSFGSCRYISRVRLGGYSKDKRTKTLYVSDNFTQSIRLNDSDSYVFVQCFSKSGKILSRSYLTLIRKRPLLEKELKRNQASHQTAVAPKESLNVIMLGVDGMSKQNFQRSMPKTRQYLLQNMQAFELRKFSKIGLNTLPNLSGMLTGLTYKELNISYWEYFDKINDRFVWSDFRKAGYRTLLSLDSDSVTAFHFLKLGWKAAPVDYYVREMVVDSSSDTLTRSNMHCYGDETEITTLTDVIVQFASVFNASSSEPYFAFSFLMRLTHDDPNMASAGDDLYLKFLKTLMGKQLLTNTVFIFFSDHGERFGPIRLTTTGMIESRTPYVFLVFPPWFKAKYPHLISTLKVNQDRLTSHFDIHATLKDLLNFQAESGKGEISSRGISLFTAIPERRTCEHIGIPAEYCACVELSQADTPSNLTRRLAATLLDKIVSLTEAIRNSCAVYELKSVNAVLKMESRKDRLAVYALLITAQPGKAVFEGNVALHSDGHTSVKGGVIRLSLYGKQANCISNPHLRNYCFCVKQV